MCMYDFSCSTKKHDKISLVMAVTAKTLLKSVASLELSVLTLTWNTKKLRVVMDKRIRAADMMWTLKSCSISDTASKYPQTASIVRMIQQALMTKRSTSLWSNNLPIML